MTTCFRIVISVFVLSLSPTMLSAQVSVGGLIDLEFRSGGKDSNPGINQTPKPGESIYTPNLRLFFDGSIDEKWSMTAVLQSDFYARTDLSPVFFSMLAVNWQPDLDKQLFISAGRLVIPFGSYSRKFMSNENAFRHLPLTHEWTLPVDKMLGYTLGYRSYTTFPGMTMIYNRMYTQGISVSGRLGDDRPFDYELLWGMASPSGFYDYGVHGMSAVMGRGVWQPFISTRIGVSAGYGPYMKPVVQNDMLDKKELSKYNQLAVGADVEFSYKYLVVRLEYLNTTWSAPHLERNTLNWAFLPTLATNSTGDWKLVDRNIDFSSQVFSGEFELRIKSIPGLTLVSRFDYSTFEEPNSLLENWMPDALTLTVIPPYSMQSDNLWVEGGFNYTVNRNIMFKATYMKPFIQDDDSFDAHTLGAQLSISF